MAFSTIHLLSIAELEPSLPTDAHYITGIVSIVWPYSSFKRSLSILLVDPDFRQRRNKGQVRISFRAASAKAIIGSGLVSSDQVKLGLAGVGWGRETEAENTPGKSVEWELEYGGRLLLQIERAGQEPLVVDVEDYAEEPDRSPIRFEANGLSPMAQKRKRESTDMYGVQVTPSVWHSPAFLRRKTDSKGGINGTSGDAFVDENDVFVDLNGGSKRKKPRFSRPGGAWTYVERSPSPTPALLNGKEVVARIVTADVNRLAKGTLPQEHIVQDVPVTQEAQKVDQDLPAQGEQTVTAPQGHDGHDSAQTSPPDPDPHNLLTEPSGAAAAHPTLPVCFEPEQRFSAKERSQSPNPSFDMSGYNPRFASYKTPMQDAAQSTNGSHLHAEPEPETLEKLTSATAIASYYTEVDTSPLLESKEDLAGSPPRESDPASSTNVQPEQPPQLEKGNDFNDSPFPVIEAPHQPNQGASLNSTNTPKVHQEVCLEDPENTDSSMTTPYYESNGMTPYVPPSPSSEERARIQRLYAAETRKRELAEIGRTNALSASHSMLEPAPTPTGPSDSSSPQQGKEDPRDRRVRFHTSAPAMDDSEMLDAEASKVPFQPSKPLTIDTDVSDSLVQPELGVEELDVPQSPKLEPMRSPGLPLVSPLTKRKTLPPTAYTKRLQRGDELDEDYEFEEEEDDEASTPSVSEDEQGDGGPPEGGESSRPDYVDSFISNVVVRRGSLESQEETIKDEQEIQASPVHIRPQNEYPLHNSGDQYGISKRRRPIPEKRLQKVAQETGSDERAGEVEGHDRPGSLDRTESHSPAFNGSDQEVEGEGPNWSSMPRASPTDSGMSDGSLNGEYDNHPFEDDDLGNLPPHSSDEAEEHAPERENGSEDAESREEALARIANSANKAMGGDYDQGDDDLYDATTEGSDIDQQLQLEMTPRSKTRIPAQELEEEGYEQVYDDDDDGYDGYEEDLEGVFDGDEGEEYVMEDADDEYEDGLEEEVGHSPSKPIEVISLDSDDDDIAAPAVTARGQASVGKAIVEPDVHSETSYHMVPPAEDQDYKDNKGYPDHDVGDASEDSLEESQRDSESNDGHDPARTPDLEIAEGESETADRDSSAESFVSQGRLSTEREADAEPRPIQPGTFTSPTLQTQRSEHEDDESISLGTAVQPEVVHQEFENEQSDLLLAEVEENSVLEVVRPEEGVIERREELVLTAEDGHETHALVQTISELPPSVVDPRLQNLPLTPVQSQQTQPKSTSTSVLPLLRNSFGAALPTPRPTQSFSPNTSFISNVELSQNLATLLPSGNATASTQSRPNLDETLKSRSSAEPDELPSPSSKYFAQSKDRLPFSSNVAEDAGDEPGGDDANAMVDEKTDGEGIAQGRMEDGVDFDEVAQEEDNGDLEEEAESETEVLDENENGQETSFYSQPDSEEEAAKDQRTSLGGESDHGEVRVKGERIKAEAVNLDGVYDRVEAKSVVEEMERQDDEVNDQDNEANLDDDEVEVDNGQIDAQDSRAIESEASDHSPSIHHRRRLTPSDQLEGATPSRVAMRLPKLRRPLQPSTPTALSLRTPIAYYSPLSSLSQSFGLTVSVICLAIQITLPSRSKAGPKDYYTTLYITDPSLHTNAPARDHSSPAVTDSPAYGTRSQRRSASTQPGFAQPSAPSSKFATAQIFRPKKIALPKSTTPETIGCVMLLRDFKVQPLPRKPSSSKATDPPRSSSSPHASSPTTSFTSPAFPPPSMQLLSTASSAWAIFHPDLPGPAQPSSPRRTRSHSTIAVAPGPDVSGPPVEYGDGEIDRVRDLQVWWRYGLDGTEKDALVGDVLARVRENEDDGKRRESVESGRGRGGKSRGRGRGVRGGARRTSRGGDAVHELRDGTRWRDDGKEALDGGSEGVHELRDGTRYRDGEDETLREGL